MGMPVWILRWFGSMVSRVRSDATDRGGSFSIVSTNAAPARAKAEPNSFKARIRVLLVGLARADHRVGLVGRARRGAARRGCVRAQLTQQFSFWWTGVRPKGHTGLEKDWAAILGRLGLIQGRDGGARQPAERRAALL